MRVPVAQFETNACSHVLCLFLYSAYCGLVLQLLSELEISSCELTESYRATTNTREMAAAIKDWTVWISKTSFYSDLYTDWKRYGSPHLTVCHIRPCGSLTYLLLITESRLKFMRAYGRELASHCHLQWMNSLLLLSSRKYIWNTLLTFPLLMSLFIAPWF